MQQSRKFQVEVFIFEDFTCNPFVQNTLGAHVWVPRKQLSWSEDFAGSPPPKKIHRNCTENRKTRPVENTFQSISGHFA